MACQSMLIVLVGSTPEYRVVEQQEAVASSQQELLQGVVFTEDIDTIVTEVRELPSEASQMEPRKLSV